MLTLKLLRESPDFVIRRLAVKNFDATEIVNRVIALDDKRKALQTESDALLAQQKKAAAAIGQLMKEGKKEEAEAEKAEVANLKARSTELLKEADAFLVVVPFYNKPPQRGIYAYFKEIASHTHKPVILYNVPGRTGANCDAETTLALARDVPNIVAVKEASGKMEQIRTILAKRPEGFAVLSGNDDDTLTMMQDGADGVISVASNVCPAEMSAFVQAAAGEEWEKAEEMEARLHPLFEALFVEPNPIPGKAAMAQLGLMENSLRLPLVPALLETEELMKNVMDALWKK